MRSERFNRATVQQRAAGVLKKPLGRALNAAPVAAVAAATAVAAACAIFPSSSLATATAVAKKEYGTLLNGSLPAVGKPAASGGTITYGQLTGQTPTDILPIIDDSTCSTDTFEFVADQYAPLYYGPSGATPKIDASASAAEPPVYSNGDKTVTIKLKPGLKWSDGKPVDANDVIFFLDLLKAGVKESSANWCQYTPSEFPDSVKSWSTKGKDTVVLQLKHSVNPNWFTNNQLQDTNGGVYPLPSQDWNIDQAGGKHLNFKNPKNARKIFDYLHKSGEAVATFATNPLWKVVDGPFSLKSFSATNSSYELTANKHYGLSPKAKFSVWSAQTYTSLTALLNAMESGSVDIGQLDAATQLGSIPTLNSKGYSVFGGPEWGWFGGTINFKDTTDHFNKIIVQPYVRKALAELIDQKGILNGVYHGWAVAAYGPVASAPFSPFVPDSVTKPTYGYNPTNAAQLLKKHGWDVKPGGQTVCAKAGTGADDCGAGIPAGTPFKFVWANQPESASATGVLESEAFASEAKQAAGVNVDLVTKTFNFLVSNYNDQNPASAKYVNDWAVNNYGGYEVDYYPTEDGIMTPGSASNLGAFDDPMATKLMKDSVASDSESAIAKEVAYLSKNYPVFYFPVQDWITAVSNKVGSATPAGFTIMTQQTYAPQFLYLNK